MFIIIIIIMIATTKYKAFQPEFSILTIIFSMEVRLQADRLKYPITVHAGVSSIEEIGGYC